MSPTSPIQKPPNIGRAGDFIIEIEGGGGENIHFIEGHRATVKWLNGLGLHIKCKVQKGHFLQKGGQARKMPEKSFLSLLQKWPIYMLVQNISRGHEILKTFWNFGAP